MPANPQTVEFLRRYYDAIDNRRVQEILGFFADDATVRPPNGDEVNWREGFQVTAAKLGNVVGTRHELTEVIEGDAGHVGYEVRIAYVLRGGEEVTLTGAAFCVIRDGRFQRQHLYADWAPLLDAAVEV